MHRFYLTPGQCRSEPALTLTGREAHHASHVLRLRRGERVAVLDGCGTQFLCEVQETGRDLVHLRVNDKSFTPPLSYRITLLQAVPKGKLFEAIIQKATELGAARIVPLLSERVVTHLDAEDASQRAAKWQQVAIEAIKQCGAPWLPQVEVPLKPSQFLARGEEVQLALIGSLQPNARHPREHFLDFRSQHQRNPSTLSVWIGPEGDFTAEEIAAVQGSGARPMTMGRLVLRTETAAIYSLAILNYELQADSWPGANLCAAPKL